MSWFAWIVVLGVIAVVWAIAAESRRRHLAMIHLIALQERERERDRQQAQRDADRRDRELRRAAAQQEERLWEEKQKWWYEKERQWDEQQERWDKEAEQWEKEEEQWEEDGELGMGIHSEELKRRATELRRRADAHSAHIEESRRFAAERDRRERDEQRLLDLYGEDGRAAVLRLLNGVDQRTNRIEPQQDRVRSAALTEGAESSSPSQSRDSERPTKGEDDDDWLVG